MRSIRAVAAAAVLASVALATGIGVALATGDDDRSGRRATAVLHDANGQRVGVAVFKERHGKVTVSATVWACPPSSTASTCTPSASVCRPSRRPADTSTPTGSRTGEHAGDLPSLLVTETAGATAVRDRPLLAQRPLRRRRQRAIVHAGRDNYANIPSPTARTRPACPAPTRHAGNRRRGRARGVRRHRAQLARVATIRAGKRRVRPSGRRQGGSGSGLSANDSAPCRSRWPQ